MELLRTLTDHDIGLEISEETKFCVRNASRAVIFNSDNKIALLSIGKHNYHKLPGGGIEEEENWQDAILREAMEEIGAPITLRGIKLGKIEEYRHRHNMHQISYCSIADLSGPLEDLNRTEEEIDNEQFPLWVALDEAIEIMEHDFPGDYEGRFIKIRDLTFLKKAKSIIV